MGNKKLQVWLPLLFSIILIAGMFFGYQLNDSGGNGKGFFSSPKRTSLQEALDLIQLKYVDSVHIDSLEGDAIEQMMTKLDPHSVYFPPVELKEANEDLAGNFEGIGVEFNVFNDTINIVYVVPNGPSEKAGLQIGDKIIKVNDSALVIKNLDNDEIKKLMRGEKGSQANLVILRDKKLMNVPVTRGTIPVPSIDASYFIEAGTGYIKLNKFTETSYPDFAAALEALQKQGLKKLILDLRGNGGGFMNEAIEMADEFLDGDKLVVYTEGVNSKKHEYHCKRNGLFEQGKLVVLIDEFTASASEVLTGALQDWDRATIIGRRSFGKGLVQEQYPLSDGSAIRLTIARYYTPLGRSIQRPYNKGKKIYMDEVFDRFSNGQLLNADSNKISIGKQFKTRSGKLLYGGGGIMPDIFVPVDTTSIQRRLNDMLLDGSVNNAVYNYYLKHRLQIDQYASAKDFVQKFNGSNEMWDGLAPYALKDSVNLNTVSIHDKDIVQKRLKALLARYRWRNAGFYEVLNSDDKAVQAALKTLNQ